MDYQKRDKSLQVWNEEFASGHWDKIFESRNEVPRYSIVSGFVHKYNPHAKILDVASGQGVLLQYLFAYETYLGIDFSEEALKLAEPVASKKNRFLRANIETYCPDESFDIIIFNEILYYMDNPVQILDRYQQFLDDDGAFIVSLHGREASHNIWKQLDTSNKYKTLYDVNIKTSTDSFNIRLMKP